jgi:thioester reductase-like protein
MQGKHMSEQLVARYQAKQQLPVAIVRPSLVSAIAGAHGCNNPCDKQRILVNSLLVLSNLLPSKRRACTLHCHYPRLQRTP